MSQRDPITSDIHKNQKFHYENVTSLRNARELALVAEERWLILNLKGIRMQRNALKVESLYFQGLKAAMFEKHASQFGDSSVHSDLKLSTVYETEFDPIPEPTYPDESPGMELNARRRTNAVTLKQSQHIDLNLGENTPKIDFDALEDQCNKEELQLLNVAPENKVSWDIEDTESEEEEEEEEEWQRVNLEMSMLVEDNEGD